MFYLKHSYKSSCFFFCTALLFQFIYNIYGQDNLDSLTPNTTSIESNTVLPAAVPVLSPEEARNANDEAVMEYNANVEGSLNASAMQSNTLLPAAVPVLSPEEARKANDEALMKYNARQKEIRNQKIKKAIKIISLSMFYIVVFVLIAYFRKHVRRYLIRFYKSPYGRLFYSRSFCSLDWLGIALVFGLTFFFSILAGQKAMRNGYIGSWYQQSGATVALSIYNTGKVTGLVAFPNSKLDDFLKKGSKGELDCSSITNEEAIPQKYTGNTSFYESTGISWLIALWWKIIGYPDWSSLYILFSVFYSLIAVAAYCALRQLTGTIPSTFLGLLLSAYPSMMHQVLFGFRDGARALFCFIAIAILLYQLKGSFRWKGTIISSFFLLLICSLSTYFRQDFILLIPFILVGTILFHGKIYSNYKKKATILLSIVTGIIISFNLPGTFNRDAMGHVLYIGMADHPYMDLLHFSADNYSKGISYSDRYGFMCAAGKAYRDRGAINIGTYNKEYDQECRKEIYSLFKLYPYDFFRIALSSSIQSMHIGSRFAERKLKWIDSAPGYGFFQEHSRDVYSDVPSWLYFLFLSLTILLFLGGGFYKNIFVIASFMFIGGIYSMQFDIRHYFYLLLISLLLAGFVFNRYLRILFILLINWKKTWKLCVSKKKLFLIHCAVFAILVGLVFVVLFFANTIQKLQIKKEISSFNAAKTDVLEFNTNRVTSKLNKNFEATEVLLPGFFNQTLDREDPKQQDFTDFLKVKFRINNAEPQEKVSVFAKYENAAEYNTFPLNVGGIINSTRTCPIRLTFNTGAGLNTLYMPVYYSRSASPFVGIEFVAEGKAIEIESVERILETNNIRTQSAFLVPSESKDMRYAGNMDWNKVFWGDKK